MVDREGDFAARMEAIERRGNRIALLIVVICIAGAIGAGGAALYLSGMFVQIRVF